MKEYQFNQRSSFDSARFDIIIGYASNGEWDAVHVTLDEWEKNGLNSNKIANIFSGQEGFMTPMIYAVMQGNVEEIIFLLNIGADPNIGIKCHFDGSSVTYDNIHILNDVCSTKLNKVNKMTPITLSLLKGDIAVFRALLEHHNSKGLASFRRLVRDLMYHDIKIRNLLPNNKQKDIDLINYITAAEISSNTPEQLQRTGTAYLSHLMPHRKIRTGDETDIH